MNAIKHRPEIDGLRAVAVIPVILFHMGFRWISGGYIGVDVFFVISGFLITSVIKKELDLGTFSFRDFWARRIRRILPAMILVTATTLAVTYAFVFKPEQQAVVSIQTAVVERHHTVCNNSKPGAFYLGVAESPYGNVLPSANSNLGAWGRMFAGIDTTLRGWQQRSES